MNSVPRNSLLQSNLQDVVLPVAVDEKGSCAFGRKVDGESPGLIIGRPLRLDPHFYLVLPWLQIELVGLMALCLAKHQKVIFGSSVQGLRVNKLVIKPERSARLGERMFNF